MQDQPGSGRRSAREPRPGAQRGWSPLAGRAISPLPHHGDQPGSPPVHAATTCWVSLPDSSRYRRGLPHPDPAPGPVMPPGPDLAEGAPKRRLPHPRVLLRRNRASPIKWLAARSAGAAISARPVSDSKLRPLRRRHSQRASSRSAHRACMTMHDQPVPKTHVFAAYGAREIRRVKRAAAGPFVRSIDGLVARRRPSGQPHRTGLAVGIGLRRWTTSRWVMEKL